MPDETSAMLRLTADIVSAFVANNSVAVGALSTTINNVYASLTGLGVAPEPRPLSRQPAVPIRSSVTPDYIVCLEDGKRLKTLRRHLMTSYGLTADAYRTKWGLPFDYPMIAPNYTRTRRSIALQIGLGTRRRTAHAAEPVETAAAEVPRRMPDRLGLSF